jgi:hypothetical protein
LIGGDRVVELTHHSESGSVVVHHAPIRAPTPILLTYATLRSTDRSWHIHI